VLRRYLWLQTDSTYKSAVETISRKRAALRNLTRASRSTIRARRAGALTSGHSPGWPSTEERGPTVRALSAIFAQYPE